jgi:uncharacterized RDD family membrane protein YckC
MKSSDAQSETEPTYCDPEEIDMSEQQFAASLDKAGEKPQFEIDGPVAAHHPDDAGARPVASAAYSAGAELEEQEKGQDDREGVFESSGVIEAQTVADAESDWRTLVSAKVSNYRERKPHKDRYPSLKLKFDPPPLMPRADLFAPVEPTEEPRTISPDLYSEAVFVKHPPTADPYPRIVMEATARVLEFPRPVVRGDELADPVVDRPRIVEAPELLPPPPAMGGILIEALHEPETARRPGFDVPLQSASLNRRIAAGIFDAALVLVSVALFGYIFVRMSDVPPVRWAIIPAASLVALLWTAYQYAFLVFSGRTPGLCAAKLHVARFDATPLSRGLRRWRVLASILSLASLGLGYAWCFLDEDQLSWHDRITRTHLAPRKTMEE